jgi:hypothetical protein
MLMGYICLHNHETVVNFVFSDNHLKMFADMFDFPPELCSKPLALIGLTGLDTLNNAVHRAIWDSFSSNRRQYRAPVQFKLLDPAHEFPPMKPKVCFIGLVHSLVQTIVNLYLQTEFINCLCCTFKT